MITKDDFVGRIGDLLFFNPPSGDLIAWSREDGRSGGWLSGDHTAFEVINDKLFCLEMQGDTPICVTSIEPETPTYTHYYNPAIVDAYADWFL